MKSEILHPKNVKCAFLRFLDAKFHFSSTLNFTDGGSIDDDRLILHLPIKSSGAYTRVAHFQGCLEEGRLFYLDYAQPHTVYNPSNESRVHLVIDVQVGNNSMFDEHILSLVSNHTRGLFLTHDEEGRKRRVLARKVALRIWQGYVRTRRDAFYQLELARWRHEHAVLTR